MLHRNRDYHLEKMEMAALIHNYLDYRIGLLPLDSFLSKTRETLTALIEYQPRVGIYRLGLLHMSILAGKEESARQEMRRMEADMDRALQGPREHCYYLYLKALLSKDTRQIVRACEEIETYFVNEKDKLFYFWLLLYLDERYQRDRAWLFTQIEGLYMGGYESPVLALELCDLINAEPLLMKKLSKVILSAIRFGLKNNYLSKEAEEEFLQLVNREKGFRPAVFSLLRMLYEREKRPEIVKLMCTILIRGGKTEHCYYPYYLEGIKCGYKIVGIQENFLKSMDHTGYDKIPDSVLRYFNYKSVLPM